MAPRSMFAELTTLRPTEGANMAFVPYVIIAATLVLLVLATQLICAAIPADELEDES